MTMFYPVPSNVGSQMVIENNLVVTFPKSITSGDVQIIAPIGGKCHVRSSDQNKTIDVSISTTLMGKEVINSILNILLEGSLVKDGDEVKEGQPLGFAMKEGLLGIHGSPIHWKAAVVLSEDEKGANVQALNPIELGGLQGGIFFADVGQQTLDAEATAKGGFFESVGKGAIIAGVGFLGGVLAGVALSK